MLINFYVESCIENTLLLNEAVMLIRHISHCGMRSVTLILKITNIFLVTNTVFEILVVFLANIELLNFFLLRYSCYKLSNLPIPVSDTHTLFWPCSKHLNTFKFKSNDNAFLIELDFHDVISKEVKSILKGD